MGERVLAAIGGVAGGSGGERRRHPLRNKPWKKELHHQKCALDKKLEEDTLMEEKKERRGEHEIEGIKRKN